MDFVIQTKTDTHVSGAYTQDDGVTPISLIGRTLVVEIVQNFKTFSGVGTIEDGVEGLFSFTIQQSVSSQLRRNSPADVRLSAPLISDPTDILPLGVFPAGVT